MYCEHCGSHVDKQLKYCKNCGAKLMREVDDKDGTPGKMLDNVLTTLFLIVMFGLGILVGLVAVLLGNNVQPQLVVMITIAYLLSVFGICYILLKQVPKLIDAKLNRNSPAPEYVEPAQLNRAATAQLEEFRPPASVVENTTRALDKVPVAER